jgi:putative acyl-CoA dehydrogenase
MPGALLVRHAPAEVADAFCGSRPAGGGGHVLGTVAAGAAARTILARSAPS